MAFGELGRVRPGPVGAHGTGRRVGAVDDLDPPACLRSLSSNRRRRMRRPSGSGGDIRRFAAADTGAAVVQLDGSTLSRKVCRLRMHESPGHLDPRCAVEPPFAPRMRLTELHLSPAKCSQPVLTDRVDAGTERDARAN